MKAKKYHTVITVLPAAEHADYAAVASRQGREVEDVIQELLLAFAARQYVNVAHQINLAEDAVRAKVAA